jgi:type III pantothenate kinase
MLLTADIGNTNTVFGLWNKQHLLSSLRVNSRLNFTPDEWIITLTSWLNSKSFDSAVIKEFAMCSVVPALNLTLFKAMEKLGCSECKEYAYHEELPIKFNYENPRLLGADRVVNAVAAVELFGDNLIIADYGTAITFCKVEERKHCGGVIVPGMEAALTGLASKSAQLPELGYIAPTGICAKNTMEGIQAGIHYGYRGLLKEIMSELLLSFKPQNRANVLRIVTGGVSSSIGYFHEFFDIVDTALTLKGLKILQHLGKRR